MSCRSAQSLVFGSTGWRVARIRPETTPASITAARHGSSHFTANSALRFSFPGFDVSGLFRTAVPSLEALPNMRPCVIRPVRLGVECVELPESGRSGRTLDTPAQSCPPFLHRGHLGRLAFLLRDQRCAPRAAGASPHAQIAATRKRMSGRCAHGVACTAEAQVAIEQSDPGHRSDSARCGEARMLRGRGRARQQFEGSPPKRSASRHLRPSDR